MELLEGLNEKQREAVLCTKGPLLILAGAGSGKTRTIIHRIAYIISQGLAWPSQILAITFTNKAAGEMRSRIAAMNIEDSSRIWIHTFHAMCARILRQHGAWIGYDQNFVIYDTDDQKRLYKQIAKDMDLDDKQFSFSLVIGEISKAKDALMNADEYIKYVQRLCDYKREKIAVFYQIYQDTLKKNNAMDFDDLIFNVLKLFRDYPDILALYQNRFKYILVDEYQDTNRAQYLLVEMLAGKYHNLCVCGDDDQSIYGWRGADITNILTFEDAFPDAKVIKLEQNYRSTNMILQAANGVIANNIDRKEKSLWTNNPGSEKIQVYSYNQGYDEAGGIVNQIGILRQEGFHYGDFAVLYRTNAQSRLFEESFMRSGIPYQLIGGTGFYSRMEIKDIITYLHVLVNPSDDLGCLRIINVPKRGIGAATIEKIREYAEFKGWGMMETILNESAIPGVGSGAMKKIADFSALMKNLQEKVDTTGIADLITAVIKESGYLTMLAEGKVDNSESRRENLEELVSSAAEFEKNSEDASITAFLETVSLASETDHYDGEDEGSVLLMTLHNAKGLEFPVVFMPGMEDGIFPHIRAIRAENDAELEEERRICYVGITRAKQRLIMSWAESRTVFGQTQLQMRSRFLRELPEACVEWHDETEKEEKRVMCQKATEKRGDLVNQKSFGSGIRKSNVNTGIRKAQQMQKSVMRSASSDGFTAGCKVKHKKFGIGTVVEVKPNQLSIAFPGLGIKRLDPGFVTKGSTD